MTAERPFPRVRDLTIEGAGAPPLAARLWSVERPRGVVVVSHGLGEHGGAYAHVAEALGRLAGVDVLAVDLRGHGRSSGRRGVVNRYEELCDDLRAAVAQAADDRPGLPRFALGHSNGGQVVLRALLDGGLDVSGVILSNPALRVLASIPRWKLGLGRFLNRFAPRVTVGTAVDLLALTRDPEMVEERRVDPLRHARVNGPLYFGLVEGGRAVADRASEVHVPLLLILGGADPIIDPDFSSAVFDVFASTDKTRLVYPEMLHEPLNDLNRETVLADLARWLSDRLPGR